MVGLIGVGQIKPVGPFPCNVLSAPRFWEPRNQPKPSPKPMSFAVSMGGVAGRGDKTLGTRLYVIKHTFIIAYNITTVLAYGIFF